MCKIKGDEIIHSGYIHSYRNESKTDDLDISEDVTNTSSQMLSANKITQRGRLNTTTEHKVHYTRETKRIRWT